MPHVFVIAAVGATALAGYKLVRREMKRVGEKLTELREKAPEPAPVVERTLVRGPDGVYRPSDRRG